MTNFEYWLERKAEEYIMLSQVIELCNRHAEKIRKNLKKRMEYDYYMDTAILAEEQLKELDYVLRNNDHIDRVLRHASIDEILGKLLEIALDEEELKKAEKDFIKNCEKVRAVKYWEDLL